MCKCAKSEKNWSFSNSGRPEATWPLFIHHIHGSSIRARLLLLGVIEWKKWFLLSRKNYVSKNEKKNQFFLISQADLRRLGPYLYIICMLVRPNYGPDIRARLLLLGVIEWKKWIFDFLEKNYVSERETYFSSEVTQKEVEPHIFYTITFGAMWYSYS